jgi:transcriptional regulator with XRE-family HTH domain
MKYTDDIVLLRAFGKRVRTLRKDQKLSQSELGARSNLEKSAIQRIERGYNCTVKTLAKLANGLDISISELMDFSEPSSDAQ